jgi:hypothetical protein
VAAATDFGAYINSSSFDAQGVELSADAVLPSGITVSASYTFMDAEVSEAFGAGAAINPAFPDIPIGRGASVSSSNQFGDGVRRLREGSSRHRVVRVLRGQARRQHVPERRLLRKLVAAAEQRSRSCVPEDTSIENLLNQDYAASYGFPSLPFTIRGGVSMRLGGDR